MTGKGTSEGHTIMSEASWNEFHADPNIKVDWLGKRHTAFTNGGVCDFTETDAGNYQVD